MAFETFVSLLVFAFAASVTPGPNNMMLFASGVNFGFARTLPHMLGIGVGFFCLILAIGFGLGALLDRYPALDLVLKILGGGYLLWIAWKIGMSRHIPDTASDANPLTFLQAAAFQWVNPKAWVMAVAAIAAYSEPAAYEKSVLLVATAFAVVNLPSVSSWALFGTVLRGWLSAPARLKWFNVSMAVLLVVSLWPMLR